MKIICETKREVNTATNCRKEYCCNGMKKAMTNYYDKSECYNSRIKFDESTEKIEIRTHISYDCGGKYTPIKYCPWCGKKITLEKIKIDNTGLPPVKEVPCKPKKKHWWN